MEKLVNKTCSACRADAPRLKDEQIQNLLPQIPEWQLIAIDGTDRLQRIYTFSNFLHAMKFTQLVGEMAESEGHHPALLTQWGQTTVTWWSHKIKGLHENDFIAAAKSDQLYFDFHISFVAKTS